VSRIIEPGELRDLRRDLAAAAALYIKTNRKNHHDVQDCRHVSAS
jgi:hypothetical protein